MDARSNGITALRLGLALWVLLMHLWPVGGFGVDPLISIVGSRLNGGGTVAVLAFFGLSGFLLATSRAHLPIHLFTWRRMLRILPAYWICIIVTSAVVGWWYARAAINPLGWVGSLTWGGFAGNPLPLINASLWTIPVELACYLMLALIPSIGLRLVAPLVALGFIAWTVTGASAFGGWQPLVFAFVVGLLISLWRIPLRAPIALAGAILAFATFGPPLGTLVATAGLVYAFLWVGLWLPLRWTTDLSYGTYIYAFPVTQLLVLAGIAKFGLLVLALAVVPATLGLAAASWYLIERPALSLKSVSIRRPRRGIPLSASVDTDAAPISASGFEVQAGQ